MTKLSKAEVLHVAQLAKIKLTDGEVEKYAKQLTGVVDFIGELSEVDTNGIEPTSQTTGLENINRPDNVKAEAILTQDQVLSGNDKTFNGYFKVDAILAERSDK